MPASACVRGDGVDDEGTPLTTPNPSNRTAMNNALDIHAIDILDVTHAEVLPGDAPDEPAWSVAAETDDGRQFTYTYRPLSAAQALHLARRVAEQGTINTCYWSEHPVAVVRSVSARYFEFEEVQDDEM